MINSHNATTIYVSQKNGNDKETGFYPQSDEKRNGPVKTIERALEYVRQMRFFGACQPVTIKVMDEEYRIDKPIIIDGAKTESIIPELPEGDFNVTIEPYKKTLISGGLRITGFKRDVFNGVECFSADVPEVNDGLWFTDFYVNGKRASFTHYPKSGKLRPVSVDNNDTALHTHSKWFIADKKDLEAIKDFRNFNDCFISYNHYWIDEHSPIESYDMDTGKIVCKYLSRFSVSSKYPASAMEYIIENVAETFSNPDEWYLDRETAKVYYIPRDSGMTPENITAYAPLTDKLIVICGSDEKSVKNVTVRRFDLAYTTGDYKSAFDVTDDVTDDVIATDENGNPIYFASDGQSVANAHGAVEMSFAEHCSVESCEMYCMGVHAIRLKDGCMHNRICNNNIHDIGAGGISSGGSKYESEDRRLNGYNTISDNIIRHIGRRYYSACGILIKHSFGNLISHNDISDLFYSGISVGWIWGYGSSVAKNNIIEYNHIYNLGQGFLSDMGGIYLLGRQSGTIVRNNMIHDVESAHYGGWGIYTDEGSSFITVENNICYNISSNCYYQHFGSMNTVRNNIFVKSKNMPVKVSRNEMHTSIIFERNIIVANGTQIYQIGYGEEDSGAIHMLSTHCNVLYDVENEVPTVIAVGDRKYTLQEANEIFGIEDGGIIADPLFVDYENNNFEICKNSPAYNLGIIPINISRIGVSEKG